MNPINKKYLKIIVGILPEAILVLILVKLGLGPILTLERMQKSSTLSKVDNAYFALAPDSLVRDLSYKRALMELSSKDSIQLVLNLPDSQAILSIHGVPIYTSKLSYIKVDPFLKKLPSSIYGESFHQALMIKTINSSIIKEPIVERQAPKDTIEAALNAYMPDTLIQHPAFVQLALTNGMNIFMEQTPNSSFDSRKTKWRLHLEYIISRSRNLMESIFTKKTFEYQPSIRLKLTSDDLRSIYRALPKKDPLIVVKY